MGEEQCDVKEKEKKRRIFKLKKMKYLKGRK